MRSRGAGQHEHRNPLTINALFPYDASDDVRGNSSKSKRKRNGIHEVSGSIPLGSTKIIQSNQLFISTTSDTPPDLSLSHRVSIVYKYWLFTHWQELSFAVARCLPCLLGTRRTPRLPVTASVD